MATTENALSGINGTKKKFSFTFPYLKTTDLKVELVRTTTADSTTTTTTLDSTEFTFPTATEVELSAGDATNWQETTGAPKADGSGYTYSGKVYRSTASDALTATFYPGSAIRSADLNDNFTQNLYVTQEANNNVTTATTDAAAAVVTADAADDNADDALRATDRLVATTTDDGSTWTLAGNNTNASTDPKGVGYAVTQAEAAVTTANTASTNATTALSNSRESDGEGGYNTAISIANTASTTATSASTTATTASTNASSAVTTANTASTNASAAVTTANTASTNASAAVVTANAASAAVSDAVLYTLKADKTAFEATTFSEDGYFEITDSTGLSDSYTSFTDGGSTSMTVSGIPAAPTFNDGIASRFSYDHSTTTFSWLGYWVTDSETRYVDQADTAANLPAGTTAQRPGTPAAGMFRYNTTESEFEGYDGSEWGEVGGGIVTLDGGNFDNGTSLVNTTEIYDGGDFDS